MLYISADSGFIWAYFATYQLMWSRKICSVGCSVAYMFDIENLYVNNVIAGPIVGQLLSQNRVGTCNKCANYTARKKGRIDINRSESLGYAKSAMGIFELGRSTCQPIIIKGEHVGIGVACSPSREPPSNDMTNILPIIIVCVP